MTLVTRTVSPVYQIVFMFVLLLVNIKTVDGQSGSKINAMGWALVLEFLTNAHPYIYTTSLPPEHAHSLQLYVHVHNYSLTLYMYTTTVPRNCSCVHVKLRGHEWSMFQGNCSCVHGGVRYIDVVHLCRHVHVPVNHSAYGLNYLSCFL